MDLLLDTHAFLWWDSADPKLGGEAAAAIADPINRIFVSAASIWEIALKRALGRLPFVGSAADAVDRNGFHQLPISSQHAERAASLPLLHRDPFDRMLVAQSLLLNLVLVTADSEVAQYAVPQLSAR